MAIPNTLHQPITFDSQLCQPGCNPIVIGQLSSCPGVANPYFEGNPVTDWALGAGLSQIGSDPLRVTGTANVSYVVSQTVTGLTTGTYTMTISRENFDAGELITAVNFTKVGGGSAFTISVPPIDGTGTGEYTENISLSDGDWLISIAVRAQMGTSPPVILDVAFNFFYLCTTNADATAFCFQLPMFTVGSNLLTLTDDEIDFDRDFTSNAGYNSTVAVSGGTCNPTPAATAYSFTPALTGALTGDGKYFIEIITGDITITYGSNPDDYTEGELIFRSSDPPNISEEYFTEADANSNIFYKTTSNFSNGDMPELFVYGAFGCDTDAGQEERDWDIDVDSYSFIPAFYEDTFTASSDTFYRIKFNMAKTTTVQVTVLDSGASVVFQATDTGPEFNKIFDTGTLPSSTVTIKFEIFDLTEYPNAGFNEAVLTDVELIQVSPWSVTLEDLDGNTIVTLTETHDTTAEDSGDSYNKNILYCLDVAAEDAGCYQFKATNTWDVDEFYVSNCVKICGEGCTEVMVSWTGDNVKFVGAECLDLFNYDYTQYFYARVDFQDFTQQFDREYYNDAAYYLQSPYTAYRNVLTMQLYPLPRFMRRAVAQALTGTFYVDGVEYRKVDEDDVAPLFSAVEPNGVRILVTPVGDFLQSRSI